MGGKFEIGVVGIFVKDISIYCMCLVSVEFVRPHCILNVTCSLMLVCPGGKD